eukprot:910398-Amphidinium_carterae.1
MWLGTEEVEQAANDYAAAAATTSTGQCGYIPLAQESTVITVAQALWQLTKERIGTQRAVELGLEMTRGDLWLQNLSPSVVHGLMTSAAVSQAARALGDKSLGLPLANLVAVGPLAPDADLKTTFGVKLRETVPEQS